MSISKPKKDSLKVKKVFSEDFPPESNFFLFCAICVTYLALGDVTNVAGAILSESDD